MSRYALTQLGDDALIQRLESLIGQDRDTTALLLAHLVEVQSRRLYVPRGYPTLYAYCVGKLGLTEDAAYARIRAARAARQYPEIFDAVADGRLGLAIVVKLEPHLLPTNARELLAAAEHKTLRQVKVLLAHWFPQPDMPTKLHAIVTREMTAPVVPAAVERVVPSTAANSSEESEPVGSNPAVPSFDRDSNAPVGPLSAVQAGAATPAAPAPGASRPPRTTPTSPGRYALQFTISEETHDRLLRVQDLLASAVTPADIPDVFDRALELLEHALERRRFAATEHPRSGRGPASSRYVSAEVKRAVWKRDGGQCTYVSDDGHRCEARRWLEYDHEKPVARGGQATVENIRLRCKAHNQFEAERAFGAGFMEEKRENQGTQ